jgi:glycine/D-amino acid oxidase-like deaminating enzyme
VIEKDFAGFGASGRNGGWLTGGFAWNHQRYLETSSEHAVRAMVEAMNGTVDEVIRVAEAEGIDADIQRTDELMVATKPAQLGRMQAEVAHRRHWGEEGRVFEMNARDLAERVRIPGALGAMVVTNVARVQPAKLVRGLAKTVERLGVRIVEGTTVTGLSSRGSVTTDHGTVEAPVILRCTEGFTAGLPGLKREWLPLNSAQIATEPLPPEVWDKIGWQGMKSWRFRQCLLLLPAHARGPHHGGRAGRALPLRVKPRHQRRAGCRDDPAADGDPAPALPGGRKAKIDHAWCGVLGVPRDWCATVGLDPRTGLGWAGGYVGVGVSTSNLAGRTLADLALGRDTDLAHLPWVNRRCERLGARALPLAGRSRDVCPAECRRPARGPAGRGAVEAGGAGELADRGGTERICAIC